MGREGGWCTGSPGHSCYQGQPSPQRQVLLPHPTGLQSLQVLSLSLSLSLSDVLFHQKSLGMIPEALGLSPAAAQVWISSQQTSLLLPVATLYRAPTWKNESGSTTGSKPAVATLSWDSMAISAWLRQGLTPTITVQNLDESTLRTKQISVTDTSMGLDLADPC